MNHKTSETLKYLLDQRAAAHHRYYEAEWNYSHCRALNLPIACKLHAAVMETCKAEIALHSALIRDVLLEVVP